MNNDLKAQTENSPATNESNLLSRAVAGLTALACVFLFTVTGCQTPEQFGAAGKAAAPQSPGLREGDTVRISFPGATNLNSTQQIRPDGSIDLPLGGQMKVAGMLPADLEKELVQRFSSQLLSKEVNVTVEAAAFPIYVTGAVLHPGKILANRPLSALEAVMEAGGADVNKANLKAVAVTRYVGDRVEHYTLNLQGALQGEQSKPFPLKPADIIFVPEKFTWF